jgi:hypothetical protein
MATYLVGIKAADLSSSTFVARTYDVRKIFAGGDGNDIPSRHLVAANQKITKFWIYGSAVTNGVSSTVTAAAYATNSGTNVAGNIVPTSKVTVTTSSNVAQWHSVTVDIDLAAFVGQYIKPAGGYSAGAAFRIRFLTTGVGGDSFYTGNDCPTPLGASASNAVMPQIYMEIEDSVVATLTDINTNEVVRVGGSISATTINMASATGLTIGGKATTSFSGSANTYTANMPDFSDGATYPSMGAQSAIITDGTNSPALAVSLQPKTTQAYVTLATVNSGSGYLGAYLSMTSGDILIFDTAAALGVTQNNVLDDTSLQTDYVGTQTIWHWNHTTQVMTQLLVTTGAGSGGGGTISMVLSGEKMTAIPLKAKKL